MKNDLKKIKDLFVVDNKEATVAAIKQIKEVIIYTSSQIQQLNNKGVDKKNVETLCTAIINNFF